MSNTDTYIEQTFEWWLEEFKPITNHLDDNASFQNEDDEGIMFETFGEELDFVAEQDPRCIWTYHHGEENSTYIANGFNIVNRLGYFITEIPFEENQIIDIVVEEPNYLCPNCEEQHWGAAGELHYEKFGDLEKCVACATMEELKEIENESANAN